MLPKRSNMPEYMQELVEFLKYKNLSDKAIDCILHKLLKDNWQPINKISH